MRKDMHQEKCAFEHRLPIGTDLQRDSGIKCAIEGQIEGKPADKID